MAGRTSEQRSAIIWLAIAVVLAAAQATVFFSPVMSLLSSVAILAGLVNSLRTTRRLASHPVAYGVGIYMAGGVFVAALLAAREGRFPNLGEFLITTLLWAGGLLAAAFALLLELVN